MKNVLTLIFLTFISINLIFAQKNIIDEKSISYTTPTSDIDETVKRGIPSSVTIFDTKSLTQIDGSYVIKLKSSTGFTCFGIGWKADNSDLSPNSFKLTYKIVKNTSATNEAEKVWGIFEEEEGYLKPSDTETDYYWTDLLFGYDEQSRQELLITLTPPADVNISEIRIDFMNLSNDIDPSHARNMMESTSKACPTLPAIIPRADWCGTYTACTNASYTPTAITATHTVIHHGASPDTYTDGYAVVRSYWNYHVNTLGWADIGYNYLVDKYGNLFQGRKNANAPYSDVRGSHAGDSNSASIGINFLGNADVTLPTTDQLNKLYAFLGWWYNNKGLDPTSSASIILQSGGTASKPRICGHKDVNVGGTSCPGTTLYGLLATIRTQTKAVIDACNTTDVTAPTTSISSPATWNTASFTSTFTDADETGGSGLKYRFYQVTDYNGTEWRANKANGFFNDNFTTALHSDWINIAGTWAISSGVLLQSDAVNSNTNLYAAVTQTSGNTYMYNWKMKISGTGTNKRAGLHFFCDDATQSNRNNSYMVYFRSDGNVVQIYEYTANTMYLRVEAPCTITAGTQYDYKVVLNSTTGEINVYQNNVLKASWTDATPLTVGNQISLRTGECTAEYDDFRVFKSRAATATISVGTATTNDIRYQNPNSSTPSGKIVSYVTDVAKNISAEKSVNVNVDFYGPNAVATVNDGTGADISTQNTATQISANWTAATDANNTVSAYYYAIGSTSGGTEILGWTNNGTALTATKTGLTLENGTTYYVSVKSVNAAGLYSTVKTSNGVLVNTADVTAPTTSITNPGWKTTTFTASFTDADNTGGSGLKYRFYQVIDYNGTEWRANKTFGFFNDNFTTAIHADWASVAGTWSIVSGVLKQSDEVNSNTNLYTAVTQTAGNTYMYNWKMKISGTGTNKRAGIHFFCDDATQSNRGNSYMVYFRADGNVAQIYEYTANTMYLMAEYPCAITVGTQYDYKIILNSTTGEISVYQNNVFIGSWTDTTPLTVGNQVSLRTGECAVEFDDFRVFKSRALTTANVTVGNGTTYEIRYQNANSTTPAGKIVSLVTDVAKNISAEASANVNVDYWGPYAITTVNDGTGADIATQASTISISANWTATTDVNNTVTAYYYAIGTSSGATNILGWTSAGTALTVTKTGLTLVNGTTYYVSVKALNSAGLYSAVKTSNGVKVVAPALQIEATVIESDAIQLEEVISESLISVYPNPSYEKIYIGIDSDLQSAELQIFDILGNKIFESENYEFGDPIYINEFSSGIYTIIVIEDGNIHSEKFIKQ